MSQKKLWITMNVTHQHPDSPAEVKDTHGIARLHTTSQSSNNEGA